MTAAKKRITLERTYQAALSDVWDLWTTKEGIESWWGPEGFSITVQSLDLRTGGKMLYTQRAVAPEVVAFMKQANLAVVTEVTITLATVKPQTRLSYETWADFIPGVKPYPASTEIELYPSGESVRMVLHIDAMHDELWTQRAVMGWESELRKLQKQIDQLSQR